MILQNFSSKLKKQGAVSDILPHKHIVYQTNTA